MTTLNETSAAAAAVAAELPAHHVAQTGFFAGARFNNPWPTWQEKSFKDVWNWQKEKRKKQLPELGHLTTNPKPTLDDFRTAFPAAIIDYAALAAPPAEAVQALWVGHATVLTQMSGFTFITDPVFSNRCSPFQFAGPRRVVPPAYEIEDQKLPHLDFVLLSHNHYDHLDHGSVMRLKSRYGEALRWYVPLGLKAWFAGVGVSNVVELDWWQEVEHKDEAAGRKVSITMTPAQHWSARGVNDRRHTLWGGYAVKGDGLSFWFAGDTAYCPVFKEIGERLGPFDLAAIPIGAYEPRWFMKPQHIDPGEALQVHQEVRSRRSISIHCCTFCLTDEPMDEPPQKLVKELEAAGEPPASFVTLQHGAIIATAGGADLNTPAVLKC